MRIAFTKTVTDLARKNSKIMLLTGDLGFSVLEQFSRDFPSQYINMGVAEQNMTGFAAGLAIEGKIPIIYSIVPFVTMRNFEQIRNDICYQNVNVKIVGTGAGFSYGSYGHTHHGLEDIGILRTLPNMTILAPGDPLEVAWATREMMQHVGPVYLRLGKSGEPVVHKKIPKVAIGSGIVLIEGESFAIFTTSTMLAIAHEAMGILQSKGIYGTLISFPTIKPIDQKLILRMAATMKYIVTVEEHSIIGGLGSAVAEVLAESNTHPHFKRLGVADAFTKGIGSQEYMRKANGLTAKQIVKSILSLLKSA